METSRLRKVERILIVACCFVIAPAITKTKENSENIVQVPRFHYLGDDSSNEDTWNYDYPRFSMPAQEKLQETKRRSSFFPVRGKKIMQNVHLFTGKSVPDSVYDFSHNSHDDYQRSPVLPEHFLENVANELDLMNSLKRTTVQKRPSSFMPMRGRKREADVGNLNVLEKYLSSKARESVLDPAYKDIIFHPHVYNGIRKVDADQNDRTNYPNFYDKSAKGDVNFLDRNQILKHFKYITDDPSVEEIENGGTASKIFSGGKIPEKRVLSFVPTRGRREQLREIESDLGVPHTVVEMSDTFPIGQMPANMSRYEYQTGGKNHQRYRRASAFMPMRGRKSLPSQHELAAYLPVDQVRSLGDTGKSSSLYDVEPELDEMIGTRENLDGMGDHRQKKDFQGAGAKFPFTQQKLRTALVMKRPLSFFAARGKRLNVSGIDIL